METQTPNTKNLCESLLSEGLASKGPFDSKKTFDSICDEILKSLPTHQKCNTEAINIFKKKIGKIISIKARTMKISEKEIKRIKLLLFDKINKGFGKKTSQRTVPIKKLEINSSDEEEDTLDKANSETNSISSKQNTDKKTRKIQKRKYKTFDQDFKEEVSEFAIEHGIDEARKKFGLSTRKVTSWVSAMTINSLGKGRKALDPAMEFNMSVWILRKIWDQVPLTQKIIRQKAATMKTEDFQFNGSKGWLEKFFLRHVELKSCFDTRTKSELKEECARCHRNAFIRLLKDHESLLKMDINSEYLICGDFSEIIYKQGNHPILNLAQDEFIDNVKLEECLFDYEKMKDMPLPNFCQPKKEEENSEEEICEESSEEFLYEDESEEECGSEDSEIIVHKEEEDSENEGINIYEEEDSEEGEENGKFEQ